MELSISEDINKTEDKDINLFIKELGEALKNSEIINKTSIKCQSTIIDKEIKEESRNSLGLTEVNYRSAIDENNFAPTIAKEFELSVDDTEILRKKIDNYLKDYSKYCGTISYHGYDMEKNQYFDDWYENGKRHRNKLTEQEFAQGYNIGQFYRITSYPIESKNYNGKLFNEIKDAIRLSVQEQLEKGISVKEINLFNLSDNIRNNKYLKPLYDNVSKKIK